MANTMLTTRPAIKETSRMAALGHDRRQHHHDHGAYTRGEVCVAGSCLVDDVGGSTG